MSDEPVKRPGHFAINCPPEVEAGHPADFVSVWHTPESFILDFLSLVRPPQPATDDAGDAVLQMHCKVISRVRLPPSQVFELMKALEKQLTRWEVETGRRRQDVDPGLPPMTD